jgi:twitching motility protein PilU
MIKHEASDLYLTLDAPASVKIHGKLVALQELPFAENEVKELAYSIMSAEQIKEFETEYEMNLAIAPDNIGRFRVNIFKQCNAVGMVIRHIQAEIFQMEDLKLPDILKKLVLASRGLILFVGATGVGKSTSLASLIDYRNTHTASHIITIEDPIEYIHQNKKSIINQREVGVDTRSYAAALKNTLRQSPDVILIGEIRDRETMEHAIAFAETGHLCLSTLHCNNANQALDRIIGFFPQGQHKQLLIDLSQNIRGIISQRLVSSLDGKRLAAFEILLGTPLVKEFIQRGDIDGLKRAMEKSENSGMCTFDAALYILYKQGLISLAEALKNADSANDLNLRISLASNGKKGVDTSNLMIQGDPDDRDT